MMSLVRAKDFRKDFKDEAINDLSLVLKPKPSTHPIFPSVVHLDGTSRIQIIEEAKNLH